MLYRGVSRRVELPLDQIASVAKMPQLDDWKLRAYRKSAICVDLAGATMLDLRLRTPVRAVGLLGPGRDAAARTAAIRWNRRSLVAVAGDTPPPRDNTTA